MVSSCGQYRLEAAIVIPQIPFNKDISWWRHQMETFSALLAICTGNSPVPGEFPAQRPVTRSLHVFFDLHLNKPLSKQSWDWWFETLSRPLWRHCNDFSYNEESTGNWTMCKSILGSMCCSVLLKSQIYLRWPVKKWLCYIMNVIFAYQITAYKIYNESISGYWMSIRKCHILQRNIHMYNSFKKENFPSRVIDKTF